MVAFELEAASAKIDRFGWSQMSDALKDRLLMDWMDCLHDFHLHEIKAALAVLLGTNPKAATNEQMVKAQILKHRARKISALPKAPEEPARKEPRVTAEQAAEIVRGFQFHVKRFGENNDQ